MKFLELARQVRMQVGADEYTLTNEQLATLYNAEVDAYAHIGVATNRNEHYLGGVKEITVASDGWVEIPSEVIRIDRIEISILGEWKVGQLYNLNRMPTLADVDLLAVIMNDKPAGYTIFGRKIFLLSKENVDSIRIYAQMYPDYVEKEIFDNEDATLEKPGNGKTGLARIWHRLLKNRMAIVWKETRDKPIPLSTHEREMVGDLQMAMKVAGIIDANRRYRMRKHKLADVYGDECVGWNVDENAHETLLVDGDGIFLTI